MKVTVETKRKAVHIGNGIWAFLLPFIPRLLAICIVLVVVFLVGVMFRPGRPRFFERIFYSMAREKDVEHGFLKGPFLYVAMVLLLVVFCDFRIAGAAFACMAFGDGFATLIGIRGKIKIFNEKTLEGSIAFFLVGTMMSGLVFYAIEAFNQPGAGFVLIDLLIIGDKTFSGVLLVPFIVMLVMIGLIASLLELFVDKYIDDNIVIPLFVAVSLTLGCYFL